MIKYIIILLYIFTLLSISCIRSSKKEKFIAPVEQIIKLESTKLGVSTILSDLNVPWEIAWGPDNQIWFTEQSGRISKVDPHTDIKKTLLNIHEVYRKGTLGLLGMAIYSGKQNHYLFVDYTFERKDSVIVSRLVRYNYTSDTLKDPLILLEIPAGSGHNGSRVAISPDAKVFWSTGDAQRDKNAQDISSPNGKILRLNMDGTIPKDNPYPGSPVWSRGHRNPEGLVFTPDGILFESENGDATDDEINIIQKGGNYGWPNVQGFCDLPDEKLYCDSTPIIEPIKDWTPCIAPSGIDYYNSEKIPEWKNSIFLATLKGVSLRVLKLNNEKNAILSEKTYFEGEFGRIRDICISPDGDIYISTSNRDWNPLGVPKPHDDRIIRIAKISNLDNLTKVKENEGTITLSGVAKINKALSPGAALYNNYCASCHKQDGNGVAGSFPALQKNSIVLGNKKLLINILLKGAAGITGTKVKFSENMPAFNFMDDQQIADVLTYIRHNWENHSDSVMSSEVKLIRKKLK
jgi:glucose/arabinose dehydrogenase/mono/diheme cytochrome c family protein